MTACNEEGDSEVYPEQDAVDDKKPGTTAWHSVKIHATDYAGEGEECGGGEETFRRVGKGFLE